HLYLLFFRYSPAPSLLRACRSNAPHRRARRGVSHGMGDKNCARRAPVHVVVRPGMWVTKILISLASVFQGVLQPLVFSAFFRLEQLFHSSQLLSNMISSHRTIPEPSLPNASSG